MIRAEEQGRADAAETSDGAQGYHASMNVLVIGCSLNPRSHSQILAREAAAALRRREVEPRLIDLRDYDLPHCDGGDSAVADPEKTRAIEQADLILLSLPIYNYAAGAVAKSLIELTGDAWQGKTVGFLCAAGGAGSYMAVLPLANSLMLDFQCVIVPRFVYATHQDFDQHQLASEKVRRRIDHLADDALRIGRALAQPRTSPSADQPSST